MLSVHPADHIDHPARYVVYKVRRFQVVRSMTLSHIPHRTRQSARFSWSFTSIERATGWLAG